VKEVGGVDEWCKRVEGMSDRRSGWNESSKELSVELGRKSSVRLRKESRSGVGGLLMVEGDRRSAGARA